MLSDTERAVVKAIESDMPLHEDPYGIIAAQIHSSRERVLESLRVMKEKGCLIRLGAVLYHRNGGYTANCMLVCRVPDDKLGQCGRELASSCRVSHCYSRKTYPDWPYNLYAMIHGRDKEEVEMLVRQFTRKNGIGRYELLYSIREIKKTSMKFPDQNFR